MKRKIGFVHTSPAAIGPLMQYYSGAAPEFEITNLLDDGLLRLLAVKDYANAYDRLREMIAVARDTYRSELVMVTCSSVSKEMIEELNEKSDLPVIKIDYPMAQLAVRTGGKIGVAATFPPTVGPTTNLLTAAAAEANAPAELVVEVIPEAYDALLANDTRRHDELLLAALDKLIAANVSTVVLAQVSMARILPQLSPEIKIPILSSLSTSLDAIRARLN